MTLTVRLDLATEAALARYCRDHGVTRSLVVQQSLAVYLVEHVPSHEAEAVDADGRLVTDFSVYRINGRKRFELELLR